MNKDNKKYSEILEETIEDEFQKEEVKTPEPVQEQSAPTPKKAKVVCAYHVVLRSDPVIKSGNVIALIKNGSNVSILGKEKNFYKVSVNGYTGYIHSDFCK